MTSSTWMTPCPRAHLGPGRPGSWMRMPRRSSAGRFPANTCECSRVWAWGWGGRHLWGCPVGCGLGLVGVYTDARISFWSVRFPTIACPKSSFGPSVGQCCTEAQGQLRRQHSFVFNRFVETRFTYHTIYPKCTVHWLLVFSQMCNHHRSQFENIFVTSGRSPVSCPALSFCLPCPLLSTLSDH